jgi:hypothetical protein
MAMILLFDFLDLTIIARLILLTTILIVVIGLTIYLRKRFASGPKRAAFVSTLPVPQAANASDDTMQALARLTRLRPYPEFNRLEGVYQGRPVRIDFYAYDDPQIRIALKNSRRLTFQVWSRQRQDPGQRFEIHPRQVRTRFFAQGRPLFQTLNRLPNLDYNLDLDIKRRRYEGDHLICTLMFNYRNVQVYPSLLAGLCRLCDIIESL